MTKQSALAEEYEPLLTVADASKILRMTEGGVRKMIQAKKLPAIRLGKEYRIPKYAINNIFSPFFSISPEDAGFGIWKNMGKKSAQQWLHQLREKDKRTLQEVLAELETW